MATAVSAVTLALALPSCKDISRFTTGPGEAYCGEIVRAPFVRQGFGLNVLLRLHLDTDRIQDTDVSAGALSTSDHIFEETPLRTIPQLAHDSLSTLNFGEGRVRNLMFAAQPRTGAAAYVIISLLENEDAEVRILRSAPPMEGEAESPPEHGPALFGVFPLVRQKGTCGF